MLAGKGVSAPSPGTTSEHTHVDRSVAQGASPPWAQDGRKGAGAGRRLLPGGKQVPVPGSRRPHLDTRSIQEHRATGQVKGRVHTRPPKGHGSAGSSGSVPVV